MKTRLFSLLALIALVFGFWWMAAVMFGFANPFRFVAATAGVLLFFALAWSARRMSASVWIFTGLLVLAGLFIFPPYSIEIPRSSWPHWLSSLRELLTGFWPILFPSIAIVLAALLLSSGWSLLLDGRNKGGEESGYSQARRKQARIAGAICLALSALLLAKMLHNLYWVLIWDSTDDSMGIFWLFMLVLVVVFAALLFARLLPRRAKFGGLAYAMIVAALMAVISMLASQVDFRRLTEARGGQVARALGTYYTREGRYPQDLHQLTPRDTRSLPGPVIIYGEDWCYDSGDDYYRLGYVDREHWSSPILTGQLVSSGGEVPDLPSICNPEISAALRKRYPDVYK